MTRAMARLVLLSGTAACTDPGNGEVSYDEFVPFDPANMASQLARLESHATIQTLRKEATLATATTAFASIEAEYESNDLSDKVAGRTDDHLEAAGYGVDAVGAFLDAQITDAIAVGSGATTEEEVAWAGQVVDKGLLVFFYHSIYHELYARHRHNLDEAFGYSGLVDDGTTWAGLATVAEGREAEFGVTLVRPMFEAFIDARVQMAAHTADDSEMLAGDNEAYNAAWQEIDTRLLQAMTYYAIHELDELDELGEGEDDVKLVETRVIWEGVEAWAKHADPTSAAAITAALYPDGVPDRSDPGYFLAGLQAVHDGSVVIDPAPIRDDLGAILDTLE